MRSSQERVRHDCRGLTVGIDLVIAMSGVLILGASHSGIAAAAALRGFGYEGVVTVVSNEEAMPYHRPPLSKEALSVAEYSPALLRPENFYKTNQIDLDRGTTIADVDVESRHAIASDGRRYEYDTLYSPVVPSRDGCRWRSILEGAAFYLRTHDDFIRLSNRLSRARSLAVIGGGLIGLEVAALAVAKGIRTTLVEAGERLMERTVSRSIAGYLLDRHQARGLEVKLDSPVASIRRDNARNIDMVILGNGELIEADLVVAAIGVVPNDHLARRAGLSVKNGILASTKDGPTIMRSTRLVTARHGSMQISAVIFVMKPSTPVRTRPKSPQPRSQALPCRRSASRDTGLIRPRFRSRWRAISTNPRLRQS